MPGIKAFIEARYKIIVFFFFAAFLFVGIAIFRDYGIPCDETYQRYNGIKAARYIVKQDPEYFTFEGKYYGVAFDILCVAIEKTLNLTDDSRAVYFMRHLLTFLLFYTGVFFFYLLAKYNFASWKMGLLGSLFLILSPRIFADAFYNSKDLPFLSIFIMSIYTLVMYLDNKASLKAAILHALACAFLIGTRVAGIIVPFFTVVFLVADWLITRPPITNGKKACANFLLYSSFLIFFTTLSWPILWKKPLYHFIGAFREMSHFPLTEGTVIYYLGNYIKVTSLPWHYIPVWIAVTTPLVFIFCFFAGCLIAIKQLLKNPIRFYLYKRNALIFIMWVFLPLFAVIAFKSVLYNGWRHMFFIYPGILMLALAGLAALFKFIKMKFPGKRHLFLNSVLIAIMAANLINVAKFMIKNHPYQNIYFNILAGSSAQNIEKNFELDYWGLSYRKALEYILKNDPDKMVKVFIAACPQEAASFILSKDEQGRLRCLSSPDEAKYLLSSYWGLREGYPYQDEYYSLKIEGTKVVAVYRLK